MSGAAKLYTPELLALTLKLAEYPWRDGLPLEGEARSASCGSTLAIGLDLDEGSRIRTIGLRVRACAVGQAAAAIFAEAASGLGGTEIAAAEAAMRRWLAGEGALPPWPGVEAVAAAHDFPGRHGAIMLPWTAALRALSNDRSPR